MAEGTIKVRVKLARGIATVRALIRHPMETGVRENRKTGGKIPAHYITEVICQHNGNKVMKANWSRGVSKNPYFSFKFRGAKAGDAIQISWVDNQGDSDATEVSIK